MKRYDDIILQFLQQYPNNEINTIKMFYEILQPILKVIQLIILQNQLDNETFQQKLDGKEELKIVDIQVFSLRL